MKHEFIRNPRKERSVRKNYIPAIILMIIFWILLLLMVVFVDPVLIKDFLIEDSYLLFILLMFMSLFFTFSLLLVSSRRGFLVSTGICVMLFLKLKDLANIINLGLLVTLLVLLEIYIGGTPKNKPVKNTEM